MTFTVTYRGADGAPVTEAVEAAGRAECLARMKARGIAVLSVKEGGRKSDGGRRMSGGKGDNRHSATGSRATGDKRQPSKRNRRSGIILLVAFIALAAGGVWWYFGGRGATALPEPEAPKKPSALAKEVKPAAAPKPLPAPVAETNAPPRPKAPLAYLKDLSPEERRAEIRRLNEEKPIDLTQPTNRIFATGTEQVMAWIFTTNLGEMPPLLPKLPDFELAHLQEILEHQNVVFEGDDEKTEDAKRTVDAAKEYLKKYIEKGGDPQSFLQFYRDELQQAFETRIKMQKQVMQVIREEPEIAAAFIDEVNAELDKKNIKHVRVPPHFKERLGLK